MGGEAPRAPKSKSTGSGGHVIVATGTASGKTLSYLMPTPGCTHPHPVKSR